MAILKSKLPELRRLKGEAFFARLEVLRSSSDAKIAGLAENAVSLAFLRRELIHLASARLKCTCALIAMLEPTAKIILFSERIETANLLYLTLKEIIPNQSGVYHSKMDRLAARQVLERFRTNDLRILISCRALDEGLNVPDADVGIVVSSTRSARQRTQRLGRILRRSGSMKRLFYLFIQQSNEENALLDARQFSGNTPLLQMSFDGTAFSSPYYDQLCLRVLDHVARRLNDPGLMEMLQQNMSLGLVRSDWLSDEEECRRRISNAAGAGERNYWTTMLYVVMEREGRL